MLRWNGTDLKDPRPLKGQFNDVEINDEQDLVLAVPDNQCLQIDCWTANRLEGRLIGYYQEIPFHFEIECGCQILASAAFMRSKWYRRAVKHAKAIVKLLKNLPEGRHDYTGGVTHYSQRVDIFATKEQRALAVGRLVNQIMQDVGNPRWHCLTPPVQTEWPQYLPVLIQKSGYQFYFSHTIDYMQRTVLMSVDLVMKDVI